MRFCALLAIPALASALVLVPAATAKADRPGFVFPAGCCYLDGAIVRTVVPPAATPNDGRDNFYAIAGGVAAQKGVVAVLSRIVQSRTERRVAAW